MKPIKQGGKMKLLLIAGLLAISSIAQAGDIFKLKKNALACFENEDIRLIVHTYRNVGEEQAYYVYKAISDEDRCFMSKESLVRLVDIDGDFYSFIFLGSPNIPLWTHKNWLFQ
jgi:hypothetical protein